jgi:hypothetical protein
MKEIKGTGNQTVCDNYCDNNLDDIIYTIELTLNIIDISNIKNKNEDKKG